ncbi:MAG: tyrosine-type recombinase/integrase [Sarcina sp.]
MKKLDILKDKLLTLNIEIETINNNTILEVLKKEILSLQSQINIIEKEQKSLSKREINAKIGILKMKMKEAQETNDLKEFTQAKNKLKELNSISKNMGNHIKALSIIQLNNIIQAIELNSLSPKRDKLLIMLGFELGLRATEILDLKIHDIYIDSGEILCRRKKNSIHNRIKISEDTHLLLKEYLKERIEFNTDSNFLFFNNKKEPLGYNGLHYIVKRFFSLAFVPIELQHYHVLKHTRGVWLAENNVPIQTIKHLLGHKNIKNTLVYASFSPTLDKKIMEKIYNSKVWRGANE